MRKVFFFSLFCFQFLLFGQDKIGVLPVVKAGNWYLHASNSEVKLPAEVQFVDLFEANGTAIFQRESGFGVLTEKGEIVVEPNYPSLISLGNSFYASEDSLGFFFFNSNPELNFKHIRYDSLRSFDNKWFFFQIDSLSFVFHPQTMQQFSILKMSRNRNSEFYYKKVIESAFEYIYFTDLDSITHLFDFSGKEIAKHDQFQFSSFSAYNDHLSFESKQHCFIKDGLGELILPKTATNLRVDDGFLYYTNSGISYRINRKTKKSFSFPCDGIYPYKEYLMIQKGNKTGLIDQTGKVLLKPIYSYFYNTKEFWHVFDGELKGILNLDFSVLIPLKYTEIYPEVDFFRVYSSFTSTYGLLHLKTGREFLPCIYDKIEINKKNIRAWSNATLTILELNENLSIKQKVVLDNVIPIDRRKARGSWNFDSRLFSIGWFYDTIPQYNKDEWISTKVIWGLKNNADSILVKAQFPAVKFVAGAPVSLIPSNTKADEFSYKMMDWTTGKQIGNYSIFSLDTMDFHTRTYARFCSPFTRGILSSDAKITEFSYIDPGDEKCLRVCQGGEKSFSETHVMESVPILNTDVNSTYFYGYSNIKDAKTHKIYYYQKITGGSWNFIDTLGNFLFEKPFMFAEAFNKGTAIVKTETGWGLVSKDSFLIQPIYTSIKRLSNFGDTAFMVQQNEEKKFTTDFTFHVNPNLNVAPEKQKGDLYQFNVKGVRQVYNAKMELLAKDLNTVYLYDFNRFAVKNKKIYEVFDSTGRSLGETENKPQNFLDPNHFTAEVKNKLGVLNLDGDTIIPFEHLKIEKIGNFFWTQNKLNESIYDLSWNLLKSTEKEKILIDSISNFFALVNDLKLTIYSESGQKMSKIKTESPVNHFFNKQFYVNRSQLAVFDISGKKINSNNEYTEIEFLSKGFSCLTDKDKNKHLFDASQREILVDFPRKKKIDFVSENCIYFRDRNVVYLYNLETEMLSKAFSAVYGNYNSGFILVKENKKGSQFTYLDNNFKNEFKQHFSKAKAFVNGYAAVCFSSGWTTINPQGLKQSFPSFGEISSLGKTNLLISHRPNFGILTAQNKIIVPCEYDQIDFLNNKLIRTFTNGEIAYFDKNGTVFYTPNLK